MSGRAVAGVRRLPCSLIVRESCGAHADKRLDGDRTA
jgi:hypothetical protein